MSNIINFRERLSRLKEDWSDDNKRDIKKWLSDNKKVNILYMSPTELKVEKERHVGEF